MDITTRLKLNSGRDIPVLGFGTWELYGEDAYKSVKFALKAGVRHIDTASMYENEREVGRAVRDSGIPRKDIFITSKVWNDDQGYNSTLKAYKNSLSRLETDYLDMYMVHWPVKDTRVDTYKALESLYKTQKVRTIGVCNYLVEHLKELMQASSVVPAVNQIELHPFDYKLRKTVIDFCWKNEIQVGAYRSLLKASQNDDAALKEIASKYRISVPQLLIRWGLEKSFIVIPRSSNPDHIKQNVDVFKFKLRLEDTELIDSLNRDLILTRFKPEDFL